MKRPTCDCLKKAYQNKYDNNPRYGMPKEILISSEDRVVVKCAGNYGTVRLKDNFCPQCGNRRVAIQEESK